MSAELEGVWSENIHQMYLRIKLFFCKAFKGYFYVSLPSFNGCSRPAPLAVTGRSEQEA
ncbi:MAG: hypothetical protein SOY97_12740 [Candidatus Metalachnospira sp.]|nr:hypothetical protein [Candidatus Metalachnospira sp.]